MQLISVAEGQRIIGVSQPTMYGFCHRTKEDGTPYYSWVVSIGGACGRKKWKVNRDKLIAWIESGGETA